MSSEAENRCVQLGFSEPLRDPSDIDLVAHNSPDWSEWDGGKIGGSPSWLNPEDLPKGAPLRCKVCARRNAESGADIQEGTLLRFIAQIYSPADSETGNDNAFHRSLYVFCCPNKHCSSAENAHESVVVLRGQLPRLNKFYPSQCHNEIDGWGKHKSNAWNIDTCVICGQRSTGRCPLSDQYFCCKQHQSDYNKARKKKIAHDDVDLSPYRFVESELVVEEEPSESSSGVDEIAAAEKINESSLFADDPEHSEGDELLEQSDLNQMTMTGSTTGTVDPVTVWFYTRVGRADGDVKGQCLRYCRWEECPDEYDEDEQDYGPLWISSSNQPSVEKDIPRCESCGSKRKFEFQIMPQIINFMKSNDIDEKTHNELILTEEGKRALMAASDIVDKAKEEGTADTLPDNFQQKQEDLVEKFRSNLLRDDKEEALDFGTIAVYSCTASCEDFADESFGAYHKEYAWRQKPLE
uniref:Programmed cell death protein 2 C-terminal domain-containing protein n=1 Tax=Chaetoceros debilis TaxID=122233 RepID=A0A7S3V5N7_9STRA|mmetsp:Transcript_9913/g.14937  ORF Transcript_9913/g.14937 Transcript_9913/m.14937 type:complete len:466 (-) Transcript_9913:15-1412(-)|eukprot:CAMPEP_0194093334 /NCGR_PEP_ID=MMETSP0149-20130528/50051_1 /TAXON_ID=122233 /ORGANISM="Chaetoceros debilis, Strain MM31A-1" /LENGTH=465 /DNA_ID=CAMNT_0038778609 /DNA_START=75 /DNA_END=1472 /DNA_ORIENTATION=-